MFHHAGKKEVRMAKKKAEPQPAEPGKAQLSVVNLKGTEAYRDWLADFAKVSHYPISTIIRLGVAEFASKQGFRPPPER